MQSVYGIARTMFLACLLAVGAMLIHQDTFKLVLQPVQRMVERVKEMAEDPLMLAAVRISSAPQASNNSNSGATDRADKGARVSNMNVGEQADTCCASKCSDPGMEKKAGRTSGGRLGAIRFWPAIQVHAVAGDMEPDRTPGTPEKQQRFNGRASLVLVAEVAARRLSAGVVAGVSAAGDVAARFRCQLAKRTSAIRHMVVDDTEDEAAQVRPELPPTTALHTAACHITPATSQSCQRA